MLTSRRSIAPKVPFRTLTKDECKCLSMLFILRSSVYLRYCSGNLQNFRRTSSSFYVAIVTFCCEAALCMSLEANDFYFPTASSSDDSRMRMWLSLCRSWSSNCISICFNYQLHLPSAGGAAASSRDFAAPAGNLRIYAKLASTARGSIRTLPMPRISCWENVPHSASRASVIFRDVEHGLGDRQYRARHSFRRSLTTKPSGFASQVLSSHLIHSLTQQQQLCGVVSTKGAPRLALADQIHAVQRR